MKILERETRDRGRRWERSVSFVCVTVRDLYMPIKMRWYVIVNLMHIRKNNKLEDGVCMLLNLI